MEIKLKQRLIGILVLVILMLIVVPLLFTGSKKRTPATELQRTMPPQPTAPVVQPVSQPAPVPTATSVIPQQPQAVSQPKPVVKVAKRPLPVMRPLPPVKVVRKAKAVKVEKAKSKVYVKRASKPHMVITPVKTKRHVRIFKPIKRPHVMPKERWVVQAASFTNLKNARILAAKLQLHGFKAYVRSSHAGHKAIHRVYVGPVITKTAAKTLTKRLYTKQRLKGLVVSYK